jgi:dTDP-4-dehydrorhamnose reductase
MGTMRYLFASYRKWGNEIFEKIQSPAWEKISSTEELLSKDLPSYGLIFFVGWSKIVPDEIVGRGNCVCLHPSKLPKYQGGSPIQHQIISNEEKSSVTLFMMNESLDAGDIIFQQDFSLEGDLDEIFSRIIEVGAMGITQSVELFELGTLERRAQELQMYHPYKRRKERHSEIKITDLLYMSARDLHNRIRSLQDPYPNAFITMKDGSKIFLTSSRYESEPQVRKKRILILGHLGMLGHMVYKYLSQYHEIDTTDLRFPSEEFENYILRYQGDYIINCIGSIPQKTKDFRINYDLPKFLERAAKARIIHPATDCEMDDDEYGRSKRRATEYIRNYGKKTKILQASVIGPELKDHKSLWDWFLMNPSRQISGYTDAIWNGITTLQWAKICLNMIISWDSYKRHNVVDGERISKFHLLFMLAEEFGNHVTMRPVSGRGKDKSLSGEIQVPSIRKQIKELKEFYY